MKYRNLENNASNDIFETLSLGQIRNHVISLSKNIKILEGVFPGKSNIRDTNYRAYPSSDIMQHSAGLITPMYAMTNGESNPLNSINYVQNEYTKFKNTFLDNINKLDLDLTDLLSV